MKKVFISYVHNNTSDVDRFCQDLKSFGIEVWLDRDEIYPGTFWAEAIRKAIQNGAFFIACFSKEYRDRAKTHMNEELTLAIEELRLRDTGKPWLIPVKLNECEIPDRDIGAGKTLRSLQVVSLYEGWTKGVQRILKVVQPESLSGQEDSASEELGERLSNRVYSEAFNLARADDFLGWRQFAKPIWPNARKALVQLGKNELLSGQQPENTEELVDQAVDIISSYISLALAGVESRSELFKDQKSVFDELLNVSDSEFSRSLTWEELRHTLGYVYHSLHGALCLNTEQIDLALDLARVKVAVYHARDFREVWKGPPLMGWSPLIGEGHCTEGWKYIASAYERWKWLSPIFAGDLEYRTSLVAYYLALHIHELASLIALGQQETLNRDSLKEFCVPLTFVSEERDINQRAISLLHRNPAVTELWSSLDVTRAEMEDSWDNWIRECEKWLRGVYKWDPPEVHHKHFFENF